MNNQEAQMTFMHLIMMLGGTAMQQMGKIVNPASKKTEMNLEAAQSVIDMIEMISIKTKGNLSSDEERLVKTTLADLQMNYVETAQATPPPSSEAPKTE